FDLGAEIQEPFALALAAEAHHVLDAGAVVPAAIEDDDLAGRGEVRHVALHVDLSLFAIGGSGQGGDAKDARTQPLGERPDRTAFAGAVTALEHDNDPQPLLFHP